MSGPLGNSTIAGRPLQELVDVYVCNMSQTLSNHDAVGNYVYVSKFEGLTLSEYCLAKTHYCKLYHNPACEPCSRDLHAAKLVLEHGIISLSLVFKTVFPSVTYLSANAKQRLLRLPLVALQINSSHNQTELYLMEKFNYSQFTTFLGDKMSVSRQPGLTKIELSRLMKLAQSRRERECIKYAAFKSAGLTATETRRRYGMTTATEIEQCIQRAEEIYKVFHDLATTQDKALMDSYGIADDSDSSGESDSQVESAMDVGNSELVDCLDDQALLQIFGNSNYNWFEVVEQVTSFYPNSDGIALSPLLEQVLLKVPYLGLSDKHLESLVHSHRAFVQVRSDTYRDDRIARSVNGEVVSETESDNPEDYLNPASAASESTKALIKKRRMAIKQRMRRIRAKSLAEERFLAQKVSSRTSKILRDCPDIGNTIESFVQDHGVGADAWRRTGVLTFDGNANLKDKVTYTKIQEHLTKVYDRKFGYGTVVELCVPRNKHRRSAKRYRGLANVTTRRARKCFNLRMNPDAHWSAALYKGLNDLQYVDGRNIVTINRDDASGFRLDTLTTCKQYANPTVVGKDVLTTRTDYVNKHPSVLQTTSYNFTQTKSTDEICVGVVKANPIHQKNPAQHFSDLGFLKVAYFMQDSITLTLGAKSP